MIKLLILTLCTYNALCTPIQTYHHIHDDIENEAEVVEAIDPLPGTRNLSEKRVPVIRLALPGGYLGLAGNKNLAERSQIPYYPERNRVTLPGVRNLDEKAIPSDVIARIAIAEQQRQNYVGVRSPAIQSLSLE